MSATEAIKGILKDKKVTQVELADKINITKQNLSNKMNRDNFSTIELVEIADALDMKLMLKDKEKNKNGKQQEYIIDYPATQKGKQKRNMTEEEKAEAARKSAETKRKNSIEQLEE